MSPYRIFHEICTQFCCAQLCCVCIISSVLTSCHLVTMTVMGKMTFQNENKTQQSMGVIAENSNQGVAKQFAVLSNGVYKDQGFLVKSNLFLSSDMAGCVIWAMVPHSKHISRPAFDAEFGAAFVRWSFSHLIIFQPSGNNCIRMDNWTAF